MDEDQRRKAWRLLGPDSSRSLHVEDLEGDIVRHGKP